MDKKGDFMQTKLNKNIKNIFNLPIDKITYQEIMNKFDRNDKNIYGNLLHATVQNKFDEEKVLKFVEELLENGYDANYQGIYTGYNFIQLALYGYTDENDEIHSYSEEFIVKLIKTAKKYNLNVNTKDNDGDSIIHTAIASEGYGGRIIPILDALGDEFNLECKDNQNKDLLQAFDIYMEEAKKTDEIWYNRLQMEEQEFKTRIGIVKLTTDETKSVEIISNQGNADKAIKLEEIQKQENIIIEELERIINNLSINTIIENKDEILSLKNRLNIISEKKSIFTKKTNSVDSIWKKYEELLEKMIQHEINILKQSNSIQKLSELKNVLDEYGFNEEIEIITEIVSEYNKKIKILDSRIRKELTILNKNGFIVEISMFNECDQNNLLDILEQFENKLLDIISEVKEQNEMLNKLSVSTDENNYFSLNLSELATIQEQNEELLIIKKQEILNDKVKKLDECIKEILELEETGIFKTDELFNIIKTSTDNKCKVKRK